MGLKEELKNANSRIESYSKAVNLLKANNSKLAEQVDDLNDQQQSAQLSQQYNQSFQAMTSGGGGGGGMGHSTFNGHGMGNGTGNGIGQQDQSEMANQFSTLLSMQRSNQAQQQQSGSQLNQMQSSSTSDSGLNVLNDHGDAKQANSTDVVCAFLKDHSEIVTKLKNSNQIMYANIITDDKYAAQFLKKMLQSGNEGYRNEISAIVQRLQT